VILTVVGSGTLVPSARRSTPALALTAGGFQATIDGGSGTLSRQAELGLDFRRTHTLFFTHVHPDHCLDLLHFLFASKYTPGFTREDPVRVVGPRGFAVFLEHLRDGLLSWTDLTTEVTELEDGEEHVWGEVVVRAVRQDHPVTDLGYRFTGPGGRVLAVTGDTGWNDGLLALAEGADVLVAECSGDAAHAMSGHLAAPEVGRLAREAKVKQVVLTHLYPLPDDRTRLAEAAAVFPGPVLLAGDGDRFAV